MDVCSLCLTSPRSPCTTVMWPAWTIQDFARTGNKQISSTNAISICNVVVCWNIVATSLGIEVLYGCNQLVEPTHDSTSLRKSTELFSYTMTLNTYGMAPLLVANSLCRHFMICYITVRCELRHNKTTC